VFLQGSQGVNTYGRTKGERGYAPMVGHLAENGLVIGDEFREGNDASQSRNLEFMRFSFGLGHWRTTCLCAKCLCAKTGKS